MELHPRQYNDLCDHAQHEYAGTLKGPQGRLVDIYFLMEADDIGLCLRYSHTCPSNYISGSLKTYITPNQHDLETAEFRFALLALFFRWAAANKIKIDPQQFVYNVIFEKSFALIEQELTQ
jgi:hypothetical protein